MTIFINKLEITIQVYVTHHILTFLKKKYCPGTNNMYPGQLEVNYTITRYTLKKIYDHLLGNNERFTI